MNGWFLYKAWKFVCAKIKRFTVGYKHILFVCRLGYYATLLISCLWLSVILFVRLFFVCHSYFLFLYVNTLQQQAQIGSWIRKAIRLHHSHQRALVPHPPQGEKRRVVLLARRSRRVWLISLCITLYTPSPP